MRGPLRQLPPSPHRDSRWLVPGSSGPSLRNDDRGHSHPDLQLNHCAEISRHDAKRALLSARRRLPSLLTPLAACRLYSGHVLGGRGTDRAGPGVRRRSPCFKQITRPQAHHSGSAGRPEGGAFTARRAQPSRRVGEFGGKPEARASGAPQARLADKEETSRVQCII
jgi:hypothetical protein